MDDEKSFIKQNDCYEVYDSKGHKGRSLYFVFVKVYRIIVVFELGR